MPTIKLRANWPGDLMDTNFVLCQTHQLDLPAAIRAATHRAESPVPEHIARLVTNRFDRAWNGHMFRRRQLPLDESVNMARSLREAPGWTKRHPAFDLWHLGAAWALGAGAFLSFDDRQKQVCKLLSLKTE